ncbi:MAG TPA: hypothetical protein VGH20_04060 [Myxococcales bacterium]|jgi:hypothetical protein
MPIIDLLVKLQIIDERQHTAVMSRSHGGAGGAVLQQVAELGYATEGAVARALSLELGLPRVDLAATPPEPAAIALLDGRTCSGNFVLPVALRESGELLWLAMADPTDQDAISLVRRKTQKRVRPAVAGPSEILRAAKSLYAARPVGVGLSPIDLDAATDDKFEVVNVSEDLDNSPLSRIARQLGVPVPPDLAARAKSRARAKSPDDDALSEANGFTTSTSKALRAIPAATLPPQSRAFDDLFALPKPAQRPGLHLSDEDLRLIEALRSSMEKGALILRALAELCVEKGLFTREEMRKRNQRP